MTGKHAEVSITLFGKKKTGRNQFYPPFLNSKILEF